MIGKTISHYRVLEKIGEGGMGVVYRAEDTKLKRHVALKFLPPELTRDADARERFIQEAQAASALDHANICTIYEVNQTDDGQMYISMACYTGETLKERIAKGPLAIDEALSIATQIAEGLSKAHKKDIVHRDIKSANIFITEDGEVKIVDFGLAKLAGQARLTRTGTTVGTVAYMSPEQARGEDVDNRTDIWSLGVVLYEMLTGGPPFKGDHEQAVVYSIVNQEPEPINVSRPDVPVAVQRIVARAMQKDRDDRYRSCSDLIAQLSGAGRRTAAQYGRRGPRERARKLFPYVALAAALALVLFSLTETFRGEESRHLPPSYKQVTFSGRVRFPALSPDGKYVAWSALENDGPYRVWVRDLETGADISIFTAPRCWVKSWSHDGSRLMVSALYGDTLGGIFVISRLGGEPRKIIDSPWPYAAWSPDGSRVAYVMVDARDINIVDLNTGETRTLTLGSELGDIADVDWSAAHDRLLFQADDTKFQTIWAMRPDGTEQSALMRAEYEPRGLILKPCWSPRGDAVYFFKFSVRGQGVVDLMKIPIDPKTAHATGDPVLVLGGLLADAGGFSITHDGKQFLYTQQTMYSNLWLVTVEGDEGSLDVEKVQLTTGTTWKSRAEISPDGDQCVFAMSSGEASNVHVMRLPRRPDGSETVEPPRQLTFFNSVCDVPVWSPNGKDIAFYSSQDGVPRVWHIASSGGTPRPFENAEYEPWVADHIAWGPGGDIIHRTVGIRGFTVLDPANGTQSPLVEADSLGYIFFPIWSPDGDKVAFFWNREGSNPPSMGVWVKDMTDGSMRKIADGAVSPLAWMPDGMYVWTLRFDMRAGPLGEVFKVPIAEGEAVPWVDLPFEQVIVDRVSMTSDGRKFVYSKEERHADAWIIENFDPDVK